MQAIIRILILELFLTATMFAQAPPPLVAPTNSAAAASNRAAELRRQFRVRTNQIAQQRQTNTAAQPQFPAFPADTTVRRGDVAAPAAQADTNAAFPTLTVPATNAMVTNVNAAVAETQVLQPPVSTPVTLPAPGAVTRGGMPIPAPGAPGPNVNGALPGVAPGTVAGPNVGAAASPVSPALSANEVIPAGAISVQGMPLDQFLEIYQMYSGRTVLRPYTLQAQGLTLKATTDLTRLEVVEAMDGVLALNNITMIPIGDKFVKAVPSNIADKEGAEISKASSDQIPMAEQFMTRIVKLKTAKPSELAPTLQTLAKAPSAVTAIDSNQTLILRDYASNIKRMLEIIEKVDVMPESDYTLEVIPIKYGKVTDIYATMSALISGGGGGATGGTTAGGAGRFGGAGRSGAPFGSAGRNGGFGSSGRYGSSGYGSSYGGGYGSSYGGSGNYYGGGGGGYYPQQLENNLVTPQQVTPAPSAGAGQSSFQRRLNDIVNKAANPEQVKILENANIVPDERSNKLLIFANKRDMIMITNIVSKVDVMLAQVLIEAIILEVNLGDTLNVGVSAVQHPKKFGEDFSGAGVVNNGQPFLSGLTNFPGTTGSGFSYFGRLGQDFDVAINALATDNKVNVLSRPRIQTSHAIPGSFFIGQTLPYVTGVTDYGYVSAGVSSRSTITKEEIGLNLDVTPYITPEGMVVMEIVQDFGQHTGDVTIDNNPIPIVNRRAASAVLTVRNGDIIMLGGFISDSRSANKSGVPFLKDIPGLGVLFRSKKNDNSRTELMILMKATVLETPEAAAFMAQGVRNDLPGVRQAEREFQDSETKRMKKVEKAEKHDTGQ